MIKLPGWLIAIIVFNVMVVIIMLNPRNGGINLFQATEQPVQNNSIPQPSTPSPAAPNQSSNQSSNQTNYTLPSICLSSITNYTKLLENVTNFTTTVTKDFNKSDDAINYINRNFSSKYYELDGYKNDLYRIADVKTVSVNNFYTDRERNFSLPIICDKNGVIGIYSACLLSNMSNIPDACHGVAVNLTECEIEKMQHGFWDDINYSSFPQPGRLNNTQLFNFTITSSRNRLEYATMSILYKTMSGESLLSSQTLRTVTGDRISITNTLNLTNFSGGSVVVLTLFKKKCYDVYTIT
jgi:hypothetical protein